MSLKELEKCIFELCKLPGIGRKTATRLALHILKMDSKSVESLANSLIDLKKNISFCKTCGSMSEEEVCHICKDETRNRKQLCIVEEAKDVILLENSGVYSGLYHVLGGKISPVDGLTPDLLSFDKLIQRIKNGQFEEVIIATNPDVDGETTAFYIKKILADFKHLKITRIATGLAVGSHLEYSDEFAILKAIENRHEI